MSATDRTDPYGATELIRKHLIGDGYDIIFDLEKSHGSWVVDARDGREYLDFYTFFASLPLGFNHPAFQEALCFERIGRAALHKPANSDAHTCELAGFSEAFSKLAMPSEFKHLFFIEGGALAVENALKTAFDWKTRKNIASGNDGCAGNKVLHFREAFHGRSGYTMSLTNTSPEKTDYYPQFDWPRVSNPKIRFPLTPGEISRVSSAEEDCVSEIHRAFSDHGDAIAAIIIEPVQGEGGDNHFRAEFFRYLRGLADDYQVLLIFDEVQTGLGLTGKMWAYEHFDICPDIVCFGKKTQVCGIMANSRVDEVSDNVFNLSSRINSTWGGGLVDMIRCEAILEVISAEGLVENARIIGRAFLEGIEAIACKFPGVISNPRGLGLMCAFDCIDTAIRDKILELCLGNGLLAIACGHSSVRFRPALNLSMEEAAEGLSRLEKSVQQL